MTFDIYTGNNETILEFNGNIFTENSPELKNALNHVTESKTSSIVLDFSKVEAITSYGLRELLQFENEMSKAGKVVNIINASHIVMELMNIAKTVYI